MANPSPSRIVVWVLTSLVLLVSVFTHLYRIDKTFVFHNDEGRDALISYRMLDTKRPILLGPETSVGNMYLGPFYYYLITPSLALSGFNPVGPAIMVALLGISTTALLIYLGKREGSIYSGLIAGLFYSVSPIMVHYSRSSWNPNVIPFFITLMFIILPLKKNWSKLAFGALTGILFQLHYVALVIPAVLYVRELILKYKSKSLKDFFLKTTPLILLGFLITTAPFWLFEIRHEFVNIQAFFTYLIEKSQSSGIAYPGYFTRLWNNAVLVSRGAVASLSESQVVPSNLLLGLISTTLILYLVQIKGIYSYLLLSSILIVSLLRETIHIHYISFLFPILAIIFGKSILRKYVLSGLTLLIFISLTPATIKSLRYSLFDNISTQSIRAKNLADYVVSQAGGQKYNFVSPTTSSTATILYYLAISSNPPQTTDQPLLFVLCEVSPCSESIATDTDLFVHGPSHPTIIDYLGYTPRLFADEKRTIIKNEWVTYDLHVATVQRDP